MTLPDWFRLCAFMGCACAIEIGAERLPLAVLQVCRLCLKWLFPIYGQALGALCPLLLLFTVEERLWPPL
jgi:hypothetical protein